MQHEARRRPRVTPDATDKLGDMVDLADHLAVGRTDTVGALFAAHGGSTPTVIWQPAEQDIRQPLLRQFSRFCRQLGDGKMGPLPMSTFDNADVGDLDGWLMRVDVVDDGRDFRYKSYGPEIKAIFGRDMTGRLTSEIGGHVSTFFAALYHATIIRREWVLSVHEPPSGIFARQWRRLIVPLTEPDDRISGFAALNVADNELRPGLEAVPDPVFLIFSDGRVFFANSAAQELFGYRSFSLKPIFLRDYCGLDVPLTDSAQRPRPHHLRTIIQLNGEVMKFSITTRPLFYRDETCHIVVAKQS